MANTNDPKVSLVVEVVGSEEAANQLEKMKGSIGDLGTASATAATSLDEMATAETAIAAQAEAVQAALQKFDTELDTIGQSGSIAHQKDQLNEFRQGVEEEITAVKKLGAEGAPAVDLLTTALQHVDDRMAALPAETAKVESALDRMTDLGRTGMAGLDTAIENAEASVDRFEKKVSSGSNVTGRDVGRITIAYENLKEEIIKAYGSIDSATPEAVASLKKLETELGKATAKTNELVNAVKDHNVRLKESGDRIGGVGNAIQGLSGVFGTHGQAIGNVAGKLGQLGTGYEALKDSLGGVGTKITGMASAAVGAEVSAGALATALSTVLAVAAAVAGEAMVILRANTDSAKVGFDGVKASALDFGKELDKSVFDASEVTSNMLAKLRDRLIDVNVAFVKALEGKSLWTEFDTAVKGFVETMLHGTTAAEEFGNALPKVTTAAETFVNRALKGIIEASNGTTLQISSLTAEIDRLSKEGITKNIAKLEALASALETALKHTNGLTAAETKAYEAKVAAIKALTAHTEKQIVSADATKNATAATHAAFDAQHKANISFEDGRVKISNLAAETTNLATKSKDGHAEISNLTAATDKFRGTTEQAATHVEQLAGATDKTGVSMNSLSLSANGWNDLTPRMIEGAASLESVFGKLNVTLAETASRMAAVQAAAAAAAGAQNSISSDRSTPSSIPGAGGTSEQG